MPKIICPNPNCRFVSEAPEQSLEQEVTCEVCNTVFVASAAGGGRKLSDIRTRLVSEAAAAQAEPVVAQAAPPPPAGAVAPVPRRRTDIPPAPAKAAGDSGDGAATYMSFRLFVYYSAVGGGAAAFVGWLFGRLPGSLHNSLLEAGLKGLLLGLMVAVALAVVDSLWNTSRQLAPAAGRVTVAAVISVIGGFLGGVAGQGLCQLTDNTFLDAMFLIFDWTLTGLLIGASLGTFDLVTQLATGQGAAGALRKLHNGVIGGAAGGIVGSFLYLVLISAWTAVFRNKPFEKLWSPSAMGFVALGACIGLLIGLAQVVLKEAWLRVESGFRAGRELIISKAAVTIGRAESCDVGLFGDPAVEKVHARIVRQGDCYLLTDGGSGAETYLNDERIAGPTELRSGDAIRVGRNVIRFQERQKRK